MQIAVIGTSRKENEKRVPIHPAHLANIPKATLSKLVFESGYGLPFGVSNETLEEMTGNRTMERAKLLDTCQTVLILKPIAEDFAGMRDGATVYGWIHSVQSPQVTQIAIEKKMTLVAFENMHLVSPRGRTHIFQKNNEMAGYCGVQHALELRGIDGYYGLPRKAVVMSFGSVSRGAILALAGHGITDITVLTRRPSHLVSNQTPGVQYRRFYKNASGQVMAEHAGKSVPLLSILTGADIIVNGILQSPNNPVTFIRNEDLPAFKKECLIIDISCDKGMSFDFARPTKFSDPVFRTGALLYYAVDHTPSLLWDSASYEISRAFLPYLQAAAAGTADAVLEEATDMREGVIVNRDILDFQNRSTAYPHLKIRKPDKKKVLRHTTPGSKQPAAQSQETNPPNKNQPA